MCRVSEGETEFCGDYHGYDTGKAVANVQKPISIDQVFALFNVLGTPANVAILPIITREKIPNFAPYTGSDAIRLPFNRYVFNVRAAYRDETDDLTVISRFGGFLR